MQKELQVIWLVISFLCLGTDLGLVVWFAVVGGADGKDDDHDEQSSTGGQNGYQGFTICWFLQGGKTQETDFTL